MGDGAAGSAGVGNMGNGSCGSLCLCTQRGLTEDNSKRYVQVDQTDLELHDCNLSMCDD